MPLNPNTEFASNAVLLASQQNRFPRGVLAWATSSTNYTLTTGTVIATGMTLSVTLTSTRFLKVTYIEPQAQTPNILGGFTLATLRQTSAAGTQLSQAIIQTPAAALMAGSLVTNYVGQYGAGTYTFVGCGSTSSTSGSPTFSRSATNLSLLLVEDLGPF